MKIKITKRDVGFFFLGIFSIFLLETILNWDQTVEAFKKGYNDGAKMEKYIEKQ
ncbi:MAG: hypothetical protein LPJ98_00445 [Cyclobacteriaceae bacterium]|nr:hypothetical protein [Cyclobacteriaceae bacterium]